jgi:hypothetical protein
MGLSNVLERKDGLDGDSQLFSVAECSKRGQLCA